MVTYKITSSPQFGDATAGDSDFVGTGTCSWGTTAAVAWGNALPVLIGAFHDGTTIVIGMARGPVLTTGASTNIGYQDVCPSSASQNNVLAMTASNVTTSHATKAFLPIGAVRATKNASDNYTFSTLDDGDGVSNFYNFGQREFDMPSGQNGAASGKFFLNNGLTAPTYTLVNNDKYSIDLKTGNVALTVGHDNAAAGTAGSGAVDLLYAAPLAYAGASGGGPQSSGAVFETAGTNSMVVVAFQTLTAIQFSYNTTAGTVTAKIMLNDQSSTARQIFFQVNYKAF